MGTCSCTVTLNLEKAGCLSGASSLSPAAQGPADNACTVPSAAVNAALLVAVSIQTPAHYCPPNQHSRMQSAGGCQKVSSPDERAAHHSPLLQSAPLCLAARPSTEEVRICGWLSSPQRPFMGTQRCRKWPATPRLLSGCCGGEAV
jgi:hypothetical protein